MVSGTDVGRLGGGDRAPPSPSTLNFYPRSLLLLWKHCDCLSQAVASHYSSNRRDCVRAVAGTGKVMCSEGGDAGQQPSVKVAVPNIVAT